jgi:hypothetical protein
MLDQDGGEMEKDKPVSEVSAIFVATMTFLRPSLVASKILACKSAGICEYIGKMASGAGSSNCAKRSEKLNQSWP